MTAVLCIQLAGGLIWLLAGGDLLVRGAVALARRLNVSPMMIALTVVAFGTSLPELMVVLRATLSGYPGLVLGNVVGSNIANVLLVAGVAAIVYPLAQGDGSVRRDSFVMVGVSLLLVVLSLKGVLTRTGGTVLLAVLVVMSLVAAREAARAYRQPGRADPREFVLGLPVRLGAILLFIGIGAVGLPVGARLVVESSVAIATTFGVSDTIVGLTVLAVATSLPELATTVVAAMQRRTEVALGTVVGSNIFNIVAILGVAAAVSPSPIPVPRHFLTFDYPAMLVAALVLSTFVWLGRPIRRTAGAVFVIAYAAYVAVLLSAV